MKSNELSKKAQELQEYLKRKIKCYLVCGWLKDDTEGDVFMVYVDSRANIDSSYFPNTWCGRPVAVQDVLPPGVKVEEPDIEWDFSSLIP